MFATQIRHHPPDLMVDAKVPLLVRVFCHLGLDVRVVDPIHERSEDRIESQRADNQTEAVVGRRLVLDGLGNVEGTR